MTFPKNRALASIDFGPNEETEKRHLLMVISCLFCRIGLPAGLNLAKSQEREVRHPEKQSEQAQK